MTLGERLKKLRIDNNFSQKIIEERTGIDSSTISAYELDKRKPSIDNLIILSKIYKIDLNYLCGLDDRRLIDTSNINDITYYKILHLLKEYDK